MMFRPAIFFASTGENDYKVFLKIMSRMQESKHPLNFEFRL
jgi:hypothetical protein